MVWLSKIGVLGLYHAVFIGQPLLGHTPADSINCSEITSYKQKYLMLRYILNLRALDTEEHMGKRQPIFDAPITIYLVGSKNCPPRAIKERLSSHHFHLIDLEELDQPVLSLIVILKEHRLKNHDFGQIATKDRFTPPFPLPRVGQKRKNFDREDQPKVSKKY